MNENMIIKFLHDTGNLKLYYAHRCPSISYKISVFIVECYIPRHYGQKKSVCYQRKNNNVPSKPRLKTKKKNFL